MEEEIHFFANYKGWQAVKKKTVGPSTEQQEMVAILASISDTATRKAFEFGGVDLQGIDAYAAELTKGKRTGYQNLAAILSGLKPGGVKEKLKTFCKEEKLLPIAETYFMRSLLLALGYPTSINGEVIAEIYPELKMPKPRGRKPKK
jgi:hypothetical protein